MRPGLGRDEASDGVDSITKAERKTGLGGRFSRPYSVGSKPVSGDNQSDEEILGPEFQRG